MCVDVLFMAMDLRMHIRQCMICIECEAMKLYLKYGTVKLEFTFKT